MILRQAPEDQMRRVQEEIQVLERVWWLRAIFKWLQVPRWHREFAAGRLSPGAEVQVAGKFSFYRPHWHRNNIYGYIFEPQIWYTSIPRVFLVAVAFQERDQRKINLIVEVNGNILELISVDLFSELGVPLPDQRRIFCPDPLVLPLHYLEGAVEEGRSEHVV